VAALQTKIPMASTVHALPAVDEDAQRKAKQAVEYREGKPLQQPHLGIGDV
jgi:hypothetical protein